MTPGRLRRRRPTLFRLMQACRSSRFCLLAIRSGARKRLPHWRGGPRGWAALVGHEHGSTGAFVSKLTIDMTTHEVLDAKDLSEDVFLFNRTTNAYEETTTQFGRLCSADLPAVSAFYDAATGLGTTERIFMN